MAKYSLNRFGTVFGGVNGPTDTPVIVIPEADWRRLVELAQAVCINPHHEANCHCPECMAEAEVDAIIERTEDANA